MYLSRIGCGFVLIVTLVRFGAFHSSSEAQDTPDAESVAEQPDSTTAKLAVEDGAERSENEQPTAAEKNQADGKAAKGIEIPLDTIWAYKMPGTKDIRELEPELLPENLYSRPAEEQRKLLKKRLWIPIALALSADSSAHWPREGQTARPGFAVEGTGRDALQRMHNVLVDGKKPRESFPAGSEISLAFFSYQCGAYFHLQHVERRGREIEIQYRNVSPLDKIMSAHLAIIPVGKLPVGKYQVEVVQLPSVQEPDKKGDEPTKLSPRYESKAKAFGERFVSGSFSFAMKEGEDD